MKVCVYGAGAIGGHIAARLANGRADVSIVARGAQLAAIRANGLTVHAKDGTLVSHPAATDDPRTLGPQDAVLVTTKAPALASVAAGIGPLLGPDTKVVFVLNGIPWWYFDGHGGELDGRRLPLLDPGDAVHTAVGPARAIGGVVYSACTVTSPGVIEVENPTSRLVLGEPDGTMSAATEAIAAVLREGGLDMVVTDRIRDWVWSKLLLNLSTGPMAVLTGAAPNVIYRDPAMVAALRASVAEGQAVAAALGCIAKVDVEAQIARGQTMTHKPSILQDLELGRPMEIDGIYAATLELARMVDVPTPTLDLLVALTKARARTAGLYGA